ncbi:hypothetical protein COW36_05610 [bacterium (Candidatus Blackallbacteria) CG17_big_fil_post_rev_8_21_14_2_50_48_46]|uniref:GIY-YIG domain-containing protein n=1 Tax=bacterium (Candidatus Blackallbacteria) CG17_big_fil_post_rev_8_21_14_2_50_48_46 TaxID=2014261 RepID=A0A2M7G842_9BACT|nr:MAG: hypothetical protein COW64_21205 [bacterium (Candidatus Blackallbacteria) CG18_big_fil_WC_8_21_14_2_50_49_26]PIW18244.1 MAG: hypothetical protein COW36_05610 [bacterium (Candidatus Blackallbacteria) CG17_big_fil_post_rev_8_21_14_2_50_48_46]PIW50675.1 MAG: hypothetical protein COW20_01875 [bacterium (Candidatus Blackallbacteria) CG13_big_fil_rev_8_21_14_2_50_49_14]
MYYVYILRCADQTLYTGLTTDPERRLQEHNLGGPRGARYTRSRLPVVQVWLSQALPDRRTAAQLECRLKKMSRQQKWTWIHAEAGDYSI